MAGRAERCGRRGMQRRISHGSIYLAGILIVHVGLLAYSARIHSSVIDEAAHLAAGLSHWQFGDFSLYRVNPPLVRMVAASPLLATSIITDWTQYYPGVKERREMAVGDDLIRANGKRIFFYATLARWACIPLSVVGAVVSYQWSRLLFGRGAGLCALALWCFSPTVLGHGSLITPDLGATAIGLAAWFAFVVWLVRPSWRSAVLAGCILGAAEGCKSTWIILFALYPAIWLAFRLLGHPTRRPPIVQLGAIIFLGWGLLAGLYGFQGVGAPLGSITPQSKLCQRLLGEQVGQEEHRVRRRFAWVPLPLPRDYVIGLDAQYRDLEGPNASFLNGRWSSKGWLHYYAYGLAVKEPIGVLALAVLSPLLWVVTVTSNVLRAGLSTRRRRLLTASALMASCPLVVFVAASLHTGMNHHVRYVMPVVPLLHIVGSGLLSGSLAWLPQRWWLGGLLASHATFSSLMAFPHSLSYFNEVAGGPANGIRHLNNSNVDWGQDLLLLSDWKKKHAPDGPMFLAYFGRVNPRHADIEFRLPSQASRSASAAERAQQLRDLAPGWYAISVTLLQGRAYFIQTPEGESVSAEQNGFSYFRVLVPAARVGYSIYIYRVSEKQAPD